MPTMAAEKGLTRRERRFLECVEANKLLFTRVHLNVHLEKKEIERASTPVFPDVKGIDIRCRDEFGFSNHFNRRNMEIEFGFGSLTVSRKAFEKALERFRNIENARKRLGVK